MILVCSSVKVLGKTVNLCVYIESDTSVKMTTSIHITANQSDNSEHDIGLPDNNAARNYQMHLDVWQSLMEAGILNDNEAPVVNQNNDSGINNIDNDHKVDSKVNIENEHGDKDDNDNDDDFEISVPPNPNQNNQMAIDNVVKDNMAIEAWAQRPSDYDDDDNSDKDNDMAMEAWAQRPSDYDDDDNSDNDDVENDDGDNDDVSVRSARRSPEYDGDNDDVSVTSARRSPEYDGVNDDSDNDDGDNDGVKNGESMHHGIAIVNVSDSEENKFENDNNDNSSVYNETTEVVAFRNKHLAMDHELDNNEILKNLKIQMQHAIEVAKDIELSRRLEKEYICLKRAIIIQYGTTTYWHDDLLPLLLERGVERIVIWKHFPQNRQEFQLNLKEKKMYEMSATGIDRKAWSIKPSWMDDWFVTRLY